MMRNIIKIVLLLIGLNFFVTVTIAQDNHCPSIVSSALDATNSTCDDAGRNQACYGNNELVAEARQGTTDFVFEQRGDIVDVAEMRTLTLSPMNQEASEWGVALIRLQANLPDTIPGQNVTFLLFGDVEIENAVDANEDLAFNPMQVLFLRSGIGDAPCEEAPDSGILIQTPEGAGQVQFTVNEVNITLASTAYLQAQPDEELVISVVEGQAEVEAQGTIQLVPAGTRVTVPLDSDLRASGPPSEPEPYKEVDLRSLPLENLDREIDLAPALILDAPVVIIVGRFADILGEPDKQAEVLGRPQKSRMTVTGVTAEGDFYRIDWNDGEGWVPANAVLEIEGDLNTITIVGAEESDFVTESCIISTDQARTVSVRVGFGENRTSVTFLEVDIEFEVVGQNTDDNSRTWYAVNKEEAAPGKSISGEVAWIAADEVKSIGSCDAVAVMDATGIVPLPQQVDDTVSDDNNASGDNTSVSIVIPSQVEWVNTGVVLTTGQSFSISATGSANLCGTGDNPNCVDDPTVNRSIGPGGNLVWERCEGQYDPCQMMPGIYGALVGRVGGGTSFYIGTGGNFVSDGDGTLQLGFNDHKFWDNTGSYSATVTLQ